MLRSLLIFLIPVSLFSQTETVTKKESHQSPLFLFNVGYRSVLNKSSIINSGNGVLVEGGINAGKFFPTKTILGIFAGWGFQDRLWNTSFSNGFVRDYKQALNAEYRSSDLDSSIVSASTQLFKNEKGTAPLQPGCETGSFHNYSLYYGIVFRPDFKNAPLIKMYRGSTRSHYQGPGRLISTSGDYTIFQLRREMIGAEVCYLLNLKKNGNTTKNNLGVSVYAESLNFYNSQLYFDDGTRTRKIRVKEFTEQKFLNKYRNEINLGVKLFFALI